MTAFVQHVSTAHRLLLALALSAGAAPVVASAQSREAGEAEWDRGQQFALAGDADASLAAYHRALQMARGTRDPGLASAARLGMAEVYAVLLQRPDSAVAAYEEAVRMAENGDRSAVNGYVRWLSRQGRVSEARALHKRAYEGIADVPRAIKHESVEYLLGEAAIQRAAGNFNAALSTLTNARDIADRLASGDGSMPLPKGANEYSYWVLYDLAELRLDSKAGRVRNAADGAALRALIDTPEAIALSKGDLRFAAARLAERIAQAKRMAQ